MPNQITPPEGSRKQKRIVGRGASARRGATAGRGTKGQNSRSGGGVSPGFEGGQMPLFRRVARRGFNNTRFAKRYDIVNIGEIGRRFDEGAEVNAETLVEKRLLKKRHGPVKLLGVGEIEIKVVVSVDAVSEGARAKITNAGGTVVDAEKVKPNGK